MKYLIDSYLLNPQHPISVNLIGCGGTGSAVLADLGRIHTSLLALGGTGLQVTVWDDDKVEPHNIGRQYAYSKTDIGEYKAAIAVTRANRFFGMEWEFIPLKFDGKKSANFTISCVDNMKARKQIKEIMSQVVREANEGLSYKTPMYWMDFGNKQHIGQVVMGTVGLEKDHPQYLPDVIDMFPSMDDHEDSEAPSCSAAEALAKQDLFINGTLAKFGCQLVWSMFRHTSLDFHGMFVNLKTCNVKPIKTQGEAG